MEILTNPLSEYNKIYEAYKEEYESRTAHLFSNEDFIIHDEDIEFSNWSENILQKLKNILKDEITYCNQEKIFFRGCNFENYKHNYTYRLQSFLNDFDDSTTSIFIDDEITYYEDSLEDVQGVIFSFYKTNNTNIIYLNRIIEIISFKQFQLSTNKILDFLKDLKFKLSNKTEKTNKIIEIMELNHDNLCLIGMNPIITEEEFLKWYSNNKNIAIDFENKVIFNNIGKLLNKTNELCHFIKSNIVLNMNEEELCNFNSFEELLTQNFSNEFKQINNSFLTDSEKFNFFRTILLEIEKKYFELNNKYYTDFSHNFLNKSILKINTSIENNTKINPTKYNKPIDKNDYLTESFKEPSNKEKDITISKDNHYKEMHNHIFKDNSFEVWQSMFNDFKIKESSRTDIKFMFEIMKYEKLIHPTVTQTALLNWINDNYQLTISKARYIDFKNDTKRLAIFNKAKSL